MFECLRSNQHLFRRLCDSELNDCAAGCGDCSCEKVFVQEFPTTAYVGLVSKLDKSFL